MQFSFDAMDLTTKCCFTNDKGNRVCMEKASLNDLKMCDLHFGIENVKREAIERDAMEKKQNKNYRVCEGFPDIECQERALPSCAYCVEHLKIADMIKKQPTKSKKDNYIDNKNYDGKGKVFPIIEDGKVVGYDCKDDINDKLACLIFCNLNVDDKQMMELIKRDGDNLCMFDNETGIWKTNDDFIQKQISLSNLRLFKLTYDEESGKWVRAKKCIDYSGTGSNIDKLMKYLKIDIEDTRFIEKNIESNIGKILFKNGIYYFDENKFVEEFNPKIVFFHRIERNFPTRDEEKIKWVRNILFDNLFECKQNADFMRASVSRAIYGDYKVRKAYFCRGETASGKGMLTDALSVTFSGLVETFDANNLLFNKSTKDEAQKNMWLIPYKTARVIISNEMSIEVDNTGKMKTVIDSNIFKRIVSGGDTLRVRGICENIYKFINRSTMFLLANDFPDFMPKDSAVSDRRENVMFPKSFVMNPNPQIPTQFKRDITIKDKFKNVDYQDALFWVIADSYTELVKGKEYFSPVTDSIEMEESNADTFDSIINEYYEMGSDSFDCEKPEYRVTVSEINKLIMSKLGISSTKIGYEFKKLSIKYGHPFESKTSNGIRYRHNLKRKTTTI